MDTTLGQDEDLIRFLDFFLIFKFTAKHNKTKGLNQIEVVCKISHEPLGRFLSHSHE